MQMPASFDKAEPDAWSWDGRRFNQSAFSIQCPTGVEQLAKEVERERKIRWRKPEHMKIERTCATLYKSLG